MYKEIFKKIVSASQKNSLTFFVGAGVSKLSEAPTWKELINSICDEMGYAKKKEYSSEDYLRIPQMYYYSLNKDDEAYYSFIAKCFDCSNLKPNIVHKMLLSFSPASFVTTNFDSLLEEAAVLSCKSYKSVACDDDIPFVNGDKFILKIHGDLEHKNIVLKEEDYLNYSDNFKLIETILKSVFSTNTVVFVGYSLNDYNIKLVLNWAKSLLQDNFNKPIFIYTDDTHLTENELLYYESRGLSVVEYYKLKDYVESKKNRFVNRYKKVIKEIQEYSDFSKDNKSKYELFDILFSLLKPLDKLSALRSQDIYKSSQKCIRIYGNGVMMTGSEGENLLEYFMEINNMEENEQSKLPSEHIEKYRVLLSVFSKARIKYYRKGDSYTEIKGIVYEFANPLCLSFDYEKMEKYIKNNYETLNDNYLKAFYFAKLKKYQSAFDLFKDVAIKAFRDKNYALYYMAQVNQKSVFAIMEHYSNLKYEHYNIDEQEIISLQSDISEQIFENMPVEFKNNYKCFKNLNSINLLYQISYESLEECSNLHKAINRNTTEWGVTSSVKVINKVNSNLHFTLSNGLLIDVYYQFIFAIEKLMSELVYKYSIQNRSETYKSVFSKNENDNICFDDIDFYCFVEYFKNENLSMLFYEYELEEIKFNNMDKIENSINNLINYYKTSIYKSRNIPVKQDYERKIKNVLILLMHMTVSQDIVDTVCTFALKYEFRNIYISDKIRFLDYQIYRKNMISGTTSKAIEDKLIFYCDKHLKGLKDKKYFNLHSDSSSINYQNLVCYINPLKPKLSRRLNSRINKFLETNPKEFYKDIFERYFDYLSSSTKKRLVNVINFELKEHFSFEIFCNLINANLEIKPDIVKAMTKYFDKYVLQQKKCLNNGLSLQTDSFRELNEIGRCYRIGVLPYDVIKKYIGYSNYFDFWVLFDEFDFSKFDVGWLLDLSQRAYEVIVENSYVKRTVCGIIAKKINEKQLNSLDEKRLTLILLKYFC